MAVIGVHARALPGLPKDYAAIAVWNAEGWYFGDVAVNGHICSIFWTIADEATEKTRG